MHVLLKQFLTEKRLGFLWSLRLAVFSILCASCRISKLDDTLLLGLKMYISISIIYSVGNSI